MHADLKRIMDIRYVKLYFTIRMVEDCILPVTKPSALRGGIGNMLLRANCIRDGKCETCDFEEECIVRRTMYSKFAIKPPFVTEGDSIGYVIECESTKERFSQGEELHFQLLLFGKTIVYLSQYIQAIYALGNAGLGKEHARFEIVAIKNTRKLDLLHGYDIAMSRYQVERISEYVDHRLEQMFGEFLEKSEREELGIPITLAFRTPLALKYQGEFLRDFQMEGIMRGIQRRIYLLDCFENIEAQEEYQRVLPSPQVIWQKTSGSGAKRFSTRQNQSMVLWGIVGEVRLEKVSLGTLQYLLAGELVHIGKNTSFGFGRFIVSR